MTTERDATGTSPTPSRALWLLLALCVAAITHGSLFPWRFALPTTPLLPTLRYYAWEQALPWPGWPDVAGNVLMFVPLAALGLLVRGRRADAGWRGVVPTVLLGGVFAFVLQLLQVFVPGRHASMADVGWNLVGLVIGVGLGLVYRYLPHGPRPVERASGAPLSFALLLLWLAVQWWPWVPRFDGQQLMQALSAVLIRPHWDEHAVVDVGMALGVVVCGALLRGLGRPFHALPALVALGLAGRVLVIGHSLSVAQLSGALIGLAVALGLLRLPRHIATRLLAVALGVWLVRFIERRLGWPLGVIDLWLPGLFWLGAFGLLAWQSRAPSVPAMR